MSAISRHNHHPAPSVLASAATDPSIDPSIRSQRHNLKLASSLAPIVGVEVCTMVSSAEAGTDHRNRFSNPFDDCLDGLVNLLWGYVRSQHTDSSVPYSESSLPASLVKRARSAAPKGSKWTVWVSTELRDKFAGAKDTFASKWTHAEFVELMLIIRDSNGAPSAGLPGTLLPKPVSQSSFTRSGGLASSVLQAPSPAPSSLLSKSLNSSSFASSFRKNSLTPASAPLTKQVTAATSATARKGRRASQIEQTTSRGFSPSASALASRAMPIPQVNVNLSQAPPTVVPSNFAPLNLPAPRSIDRRRASMPALAGPHERSISSSLPSNRGLAFGGWGGFGGENHEDSFGMEPLEDLFDDEDEDYEGEEDDEDSFDDDEDLEDGRGPVGDDQLDSSKVNKTDLELDYDLLPPEDDPSHFHHDLSSDYFPFGMQPPPPPTRNSIDVPSQLSIDLQHQQQYMMMLIMEQQLQLQQQHQLLQSYHTSRTFPGGEAPPPFYATTTAPPTEAEKIAWLMDDEKLPRELFEQMILVDDDSDGDEVKVGAGLLQQPQQQQVLGGWSAPQNPVTDVELHNPAADNDILDALTDAKKFMALMASTTTCNVSTPNSFTAAQGPPPSFHVASTTSIHPQRPSAALNTIAQVASEAFGGSLFAQQQRGTAGPGDFGYGAYYFDELPPYLDETLPIATSNQTAPVASHLSSAEPLADMEWSDSSAFHIETDELGPIVDAGWSSSAGDAPPGLDYEEFFDFSDETKGSGEVGATVTATGSATESQQQQDAEPLPPYIGRAIAPMTQASSSSTIEEEGRTRRPRKVVQVEEEEEEGEDGETAEGPSPSPSGPVDPPPYIAAPNSSLGEAREEVRKEQDITSVPFSEPRQGGSALQISSFEVVASSSSSSLSYPTASVAQPLQSWGSETGWDGSDSWKGMIGGDGVGVGWGGTFDGGGFIVRVEEDGDGDCVMDG
ncbi:hypothetical protein HDU67_005594 [Dinochytrium kinnereticum]|nr:hypothetical protein HDU67_005594 [Dinochytrium kinnereticum]